MTQSGHTQRPLLPRIAVLPVARVLIRSTDERPLVVEESPSSSLVEPPQRCSGPPRRLSETACLSRLKLTPLCEQSTHISVHLGHPLASDHGPITRASRAKQPSMAKPAPVPGKRLRTAPSRQR